MDTDDRALIERCRNGDVAAFEPLVEKYRDRVWRLAYNVLRDREEAWDVAQEAFIRAWQALPTFRGQSAFYTWLFRIVMNMATDRVRSSRARGRAFGTERVPEEDWERAMVDPTPRPDHEARRAQERDRIMLALGALPEHHRTIIMLSDLEGLSYREIAEVLDVPMGTVMSRLHNARKRLRDILGPMLVLVLAVLAGGLALLGGPVTASAQQVVRFSAQVLLASDNATQGGGGVLPEELRLLLPKLHQLFRYREYRLIQPYRGEAVVGGVQRWPMPGDRALEISPEGVIGNAARLRVRLQRGAVTEVTTNMQAAPGAPAIIGGPRHADGVLIVVIWFTP